jgi:hypothetical protein
MSEDHNNFSEKNHVVLDTIRNYKIYFPWNNFDFIKK